MIDNDPFFETLYKNYFRVIFSFFVKQGFSREEAEDLSQKTFLRVYENREHYRGESKWRYLRTVARNVLANELRYRAALKRQQSQTFLVEELDHVTLEDHPRQSSNSSLQDDRLDLERLAWAIERLPKVDRSCVLLWLQGERQRAIGIELGCTTDAVKARLFRIKQTLRATLVEGHLPLRSARDEEKGSIDGRRHQQRDEQPELVRKASR